jgi:hypothetical protein
VSLTTQTRSIDGLQFSVTQLPGFKAMTMFHRLVRAIGPAAGALGKEIDLATLGKGKLEDILGNIDLGQAARGMLAAIPKLTESMSPAELEGITRELLESSTVVMENGVQGPLLPQFDRVMQGRTSTALKLLAFAIGVNYGNFFDALKGLAAAASQKLSSEGSPSP